MEQAAKTFTIAGKEKSRLFKVTETTVMTKGGTPATMTDLVANEEVRGNYVKAADGSMEAKTVKIGPMTDAEKAEKQSSKEEGKGRRFHFGCARRFAETVSEVLFRRRSSAPSLDANPCAAMPRF